MDGNGGPDKDVGLSHFTSLLGLPPWAVGTLDSLELDDITVVVSPDAVPEVLGRKEGVRRCLLQSLVLVLVRQDVKVEKRANQV